VPASHGVIVEGLPQLNRAFRLADRRVANDLRDRLAEAAEPVRADAERLVTAGIRRIGVPWSLMRVGTTVHSVYVAPKRRGTREERKRRRNLAPLLLEQMQASLERNEGDVVRSVDDLLVEIGRDWERV